MLAMVQTVAFILHKDRLFTLRGEKLVAFRAFRARARRNDYEMDYKDQHGFYWAYLKQS